MTASADSQIGDEGAGRLADALQANAVLQAIDLNGATT